MEIDGKLYYTYEELRPIALEAMRNELINRSNTSGHKFIGNINKMYDSKLQIGKWIESNGYVKIRKMINRERKLYYIKLDEILDK